MTNEAEVPRVLLADDQQDVLVALKLLLADDGYRLETAATPPAVLSAVEERQFDAVVMDLNYTRDTTSGREGLTLLQCIRGMDSSLPVIVMTAWGSIEGAVEAMKHGANDYVEKPWNDERLRRTLNTQIELGRAQRQSARLQAQNQRLQRAGLPAMIAESPPMENLIGILERVAASDANVLITGDHGMGRDVAAQWLPAASDRASKALGTVNAGGLSEGVAESELFGHVEGAFTDARTDRIGCFALADGGTLFLDEIANMPVKLQPKLLRVLQTGEVQKVGSSRVTFVNVRVLSATNADLAAEIGSGRFREDLLYRLNTVVIHLPPIRERREDIWPLAEHYLARYSDRYRRSFEGFDRSARQALESHLWPGNVRELGHAIERAVLMSPGHLITATDLGLQAPAGP